MTEQTSTATCKFPGCQNAPETATAKPGRPPQYCADPAHTPVSAWRERKRLADAERGVVTSDAETEQPVTMARVTGAEMLRQMRDLAGQLAGVAERLTGAVATIGDPTAAEVSGHLAAEQARARDAHDRLAETAAAQAAELDQIREETQARIAAAEEGRDSAIAAAEADKAAAIAEAAQRASRAETQAREAIEQALAETETLVRAANDARDQAVT